MEVRGGVLEVLFFYQTWFLPLVHNPPVVSKLMVCRWIFIVQLKLWDIRTEPNGFYHYNPQVLWHIYFPPVPIMSLVSFLSGTWKFLGDGNWEYRAMARVSSYLLYPHKFRYDTTCWDNHVSHNGQYVLELLKSSAEQKELTCLGGNRSTSAHATTAVWHRYPVLLSCLRQTVSTIVHPLVHEGSRSVPAFVSYIKTSVSD
jgi:hypothetical protein